ncbi:hypothetical protein Ae263Ps1_6113c [Pseudonocardia sp. Ae263_Ps1]|nr:hypothetical protein Ae263Ps1_6113c [Pseudonocardia sp. Ae263_Ps1]
MAAAAVPTMATGPTRRLRLDVRERATESSATR